METSSASSTALVWFLRDSFTRVTGKWAFSAGSSESELICAKNGPFSHYLKYLCTWLKYSLERENCFVLWLNQVHGLNSLILKTILAALKQTKYGKIRAWTLEGIIVKFLAFLGQIYQGYIRDSCMWMLKQNLCTNKQTLSIDAKVLMFWRAYLLDSLILVMISLRSPWQIIDG